MNSTTANSSSTIEAAEGPIPRAGTRPHEKTFVTTTANAPAMVRRADNRTGVLRAAGRSCIVAVVPKGPATIPGNSSMEKKR